MCPPTGDSYENSAIGPELWIGYDPGMNVLAPYLLVQRIRNPGATVLGLCVVFLIPIVSLMVLMGYRAELQDRLHEDPDADALPDFSFSRFGDLITRGIWPFLYLLIQNVLWGMAYFVSYILMILILFDGRFGGPIDPWWFALVVGGWAVSIGFVYVVTTLLVAPFLLYSSRVRRFAFGECCKFALEFYRRCGWIMIGVLIPKLFLDSLVAAIGFLVCFIGVYPAWVVVTLGESHTFMQLYRRYLARGGTPVPPYVDKKRDDDDEDDNE